MVNDWVWAKKHVCNSYTKQKIKIMINHLIKEYYLMVGNLMLLQCVGIPMGIGPAPFWDNFYMYDYKADFISSIIKTH